jgi:hypothetical protein
VKETWIAILLAACALVACKQPAPETPESDKDAIKALGSTIPASQFDRSFWQREHDASSSVWLEANRLCGQTVLASYPNCLPVNDILETDRRRKAEAGNKAATKIEEMGRRGYGYDYRRKEWLPDREVLAVGCTSVPAYPCNSARTGFYTWQCPVGTTIPQGIPDARFSKEEEGATN